MGCAGLTVNVLKRDSAINWFLSIGYLVGNNAINTAISAAIAKEIRWTADAYFAE